MIVYTNCVEQWGWVRTTEKGIGPLKATSVMEFSMADTTQEEINKLMYYEACEEASRRPMSTVKRKHTDLVVVKSPFCKVTYERCHWKHVD